MISAAEKPMDALQVINLDEVRSQIDFGIITVREDEFEAVLRQFRPKWLAQSEREYNIATVQTSTGQHYGVAIIRTSEQGNGAAQQAANDLIRELRPACLVLIGIGGAKPDFEFSLGDVAVATRLHDFSVRAVQAGGYTETTDLGGPVHALIERAVANLRAITQNLGNWNSDGRIGVERPSVDFAPHNFTGDPVWNEKVRAALAHRFNSSDLSWQRPRVTAVATGAGNVLVKDYAFLKGWLSHARDLSVVEMELPGVYAAARSVQGDLPILAIRGISDIIGFVRDPRWTEYACRTAASFAQAYLSAGVLKINAKTKTGVLQGSIAPFVRGERSTSEAGRVASRIPALPIRSEAVHRKPWPENITMRFAVDRTPLAAVTVGVHHQALLDSCHEAEELLHKIADDRFGKRHWSLWQPGQSCLKDDSTASGLIWPVEGDPSVADIEETVRAVFERSRGKSGDHKPNVLSLTLDGAREGDALAYMKVLRDTILGLDIKVAVHGWSATASDRFHQHLIGGQSAASNTNQPDANEQTLVRLLRETRNARSRHEAAATISSKSVFALRDLRALQAFASSKQSAEDFKKFLSNSTVEECRIADLAGLLVGDRTVPTEGEAERANSIVKASAMKADLRIVLVSLPVCQASVAALAEADVSVRVALGLLTSCEISAVPAPWSGLPVDLWRRGRALVLS
jgi:nucleoside phosphorylase